MIVIKENGIVYNYEDYLKERQEFYGFVNSFEGCSIFAAMKDENGELAEEDDGQ